jgi:hydroxymethylbilane synthase
VLFRSPGGGRVGTGSVRRRAQLSWLRADLTFGGLRGNIETRLEKASEFDAIVVAFAALRRLGRAGVADEVLDVSLLVPQVGQGALAVECRADDERVAGILADADHEPSHVALGAERAWLAELGGGCDRPVGAYATVAADGTVRLIAMLSSGDGRLMVRRHDEGGDAEELGRTLARQMLERAGGTMVLDEASPAIVPVPDLLR